MLTQADSGHGGQTRDLDGEEIDGYDEVIFPVDYLTAGHIVDDVSFQLIGAAEHPDTDGFEGHAQDTGETLTSRVSLNSESSSTRSMLWLNTLLFSGSV